MEKYTLPTGFADMMSFRLVDALIGRCSRRFFMGANIPVVCSPIHRAKSPIG